MRITTIFPLQEFISGTNLRDRLFLGLVFCFPIFSLTIRHWLSGIYAILILLSLFSLHQCRHKLYKEEKILLILTLLLLLSFFFSASINHWSINSEKRIGTVLKFIFFIPLYLNLRRYDNLTKLLFRGILIASFILLTTALYDIEIRKLPWGIGIYGPIIFGDLSVLYFGIILLILILEKQPQAVSWFYISASLSAFTAGMLSGSRNAWLTAVITILIVPFLTTRKNKLKYLILISLPIILFFGSIFAFNKPFHNRMFLAISQTISFIKDGAPRDKPLTNDSIGIRLEQWHSALILYKEAPFFGFGGGNAAKEINRLALEGRVHPDLYNPASETNIGGIHNTYFETLLTEGSIGLIIMLSFLLYPLFVFVRLRKTDMLLSSTGILFLLDFMLFGTTENPFNADNFSSVYLVLLGILFSAAMHKLYPKTSN